MAIIGGDPPESAFVIYYFCLSCEKLAGDVAPGWVLVVPGWVLVVGLAANFGITWNPQLDPRNPMDFSSS